MSHTNESIKANIHRHERLHAAKSNVVKPGRNLTYESHLVGSYLPERTGVDDPMCSSRR